MPRFILVDPSIVGLGGHHYEYADRVLRAAQEHGYETVLATNRRCEVGSPATSQTHAVFQHEFWYSGPRLKLFRGPRRALAPVERWLVRLALAVLLSPLGIVWVNRRSVVECCRLLAAGTLRERLLIGVCLVPVSAVNLSRMLAKTALLLVPGGQKLKEHAIDLATRAKSSTAFRLRAARGLVVQALRFWFARTKTRGFARDLATLFDRVSLASGDVVFLPTVGAAEVEGLGRFFRAHPHSRLASWHLVFRRNIYEGRDPEYRKQDEGQRPLRNTLRRFTSAVAGHVVRFHTDTEQLTDQYRRLGVVPFATLPIPVDPAYRRAPLATGRAEALCAVYMGDAREEKGYPLLARAVQDVWPDLVTTGRLRFAFQSNYATEPGDAPCVVARSQLESLDRRHVQLVTEPLTSRQYQEMLSAADLAIVPFDRDNYYARSSGTFTEALVAGVPVVVPGASWMATQIAAFVDRYHRDLVTHSHLTPLRYAADELQWFMRVPKSRRGAAHELPARWEEGALWLGGQALRGTWIDLGPEATHVVVALGQCDGSSGHFVRVELIQQDERGRTLAEEKWIVGGGPEYPGSIATCLRSEARRAWVGFANAFSTAPIAIQDLELTVVASTAPLPLSAAGLVYQEPGEIAACLREFAAHAEHYSQTAREFATPWRAYHDPRQLVRQLLEMPPQPHTVPPHHWRIAAARCATPQQAEAVAP
ncbi:MAG: hypothetical protein HYX69_06210 [Planctomycetia bacterium]|nr:hypothetical protein [Planctomycetia bacterium]